MSPASEWSDWRWQMRNAVRSLEQLERAVPLTDDERAGCLQTASMFRLGITPYYLSLIDKGHPFCPVRMQAIPTRAESRVREGELKDPLGEDKTRPVEAMPGFPLSRHRQLPPLHQLPWQLPPWPCLRPDEALYVSQSAARLS